MGALTANAAVNARNSRTCDASPRCVPVSCTTSKVSVPVSDSWTTARARMPTSRKAEPRKVYTKNLTAACARRAKPQPAMRKYTGTRVRSKKTRNSTRSSATKLPRQPDQEQRDAVEAEVPRDAGGGNPLVAADELVAGDAHVEPDADGDGQGQGGQRADDADGLHGDALGPLPQAPGDDGDHGGGDGRQQDEGGEERECGVAHGGVSSRSG